MGKIYTITSGKGGVGKSTTTANLALGMAIAGKKVVAIDLDIGLRNLDMILGLENRIVYNIIDLLEGRAKLNSALIRDKRGDNLKLLAASQTNSKEDLSKEKFLDLLNLLKEQFDFVFIDSPAGIETGFSNAFAGAEGVIIVATPEISSIRDADRVVGILEANGKHNISLIVNRIKPEMVKKGEMMSQDDILQILAIDLLGIVPDDPKMIEYTNKGEPAVLDKISVTANAYINITRRLMGEDVPQLELKPKSFLRKLFERL
ncbi:MAG: septum site-determining protein MinD [Epsilonproteobacteria bacterium]|nr:septum site-determining protein MinD [Campylobacterota bacterium]